MMRIVTISKAAVGVLAVAAIGVLMASTAGAAPTDADFQVDIGIATTFGNSAFPAIPNGGTARVTSRNFLVGARVRLIPAQSASATMRLELSDGLGWGADNPAATANCTGTATTAECLTMPIRPDPAGDTEEHFGWNVVASQFGRYTVKAQIVGTSTPDPALSNNVASITVVVAEFTGGGSGSTTASAVKIRPTTPKAGSVVSATVRISADGPPVRPTALRCTGTLSGAKLASTRRAGFGAATCLYRPPSSARGKTLRGAISFSVRSQKFLRRFSTKLS
jgi:hypothetical protein